MTTARSLLVDPDTPGFHHCFSRCVRRAWSARRNVSWLERVSFSSYRHRSRFISCAPVDLFARAKCRELIQHVELNCEWVARRLYKECFFGGSVSAETRSETKDRLAFGLDAVARLATFNPYVVGSAFTAADCAAYIHFMMMRLATQAIYGYDMVVTRLPQVAAYMIFIETRPHVQTITAGRAAAIDAFLALNVHYDG